MAADKTIIEAMGQRYAPVKVDYKPYFDGLTTVATALTNMRKRINKLDRSLVNKQISTEVKGQNETFSKLRNMSVNDPQFLAVFEDYLKTATNNKNKLENVVKNLELNLKGVSNSVNMAEEMYYGTILENGISFARVLTVGGLELNKYLNDDTKTIKEKKLFIMENGIRDQILSYEGNFIDANNLKTQFVQKKDSEELYDHTIQVIQKLIPIRSASAANQDPMNTWNETKNVSLAYIEDMINENPNVLLSAMSDRTYKFAGGGRKSFIDHMWNSNEELKTQYDEWLNTDPDGKGPEKAPVDRNPNSKEVERMRISFVIAQHNAEGGDLSGEFLNFIESAYDSYNEDGSGDGTETPPPPPGDLETVVQNAIDDADSNDDVKIIAQLNKVNKENNLGFTFENPSSGVNSIKVTKTIDGKTYTQTFRTKINFRANPNFENEIKAFMKDPVAYTLINEDKTQTKKTTNKKDFDFKNDPYNFNKK